ncbi:hypothetical protein BCP78_0129 [Bacillus phage BCP78]|uniref:Uncharacterized protein n=3 Tax=Tsarbombavirus BCP78 TaxID=1985182 RepID=J9PRY7_9CAUD|nr:hypothetical protein BCP78_0129 [Bacillus phage BCP78]YP_009783492.1 hypothetical protein QLX27_gp119 [Bacillus phage BCU4]AEW47136.1 hypothetical protein BCP78_0129 [Bacillus phage BCP78]AEW47625.1 hypothetical protein BCU4_0119 [Bacillus phage BCU4]AQN32508.1 hypothetical protein BCP12_090 [Bacillus phage BCP12]
MRSPRSKQLTRRYAMKHTKEHDGDIFLISAALAHYFKVARLAKELGMSKNRKTSNRHECPACKSRMFSDTYYEGHYAVESWTTCNGCRLYWGTTYGHNEHGEVHDGTPIAYLGTVEELISYKRKERSLQKSKFFKKKKSQRRRG